MAIVGIALVAAAFGARHLLTASGLGFDLPFGVGIGGRNYVLPLSTICFWLLLIVGLLLMAAGMYRGRTG